MLKQGAKVRKSKRKKSEQLVSESEFNQTETSLDDSNLQNNIICNICDRKFRSKTQLKYHKKYLLISSFVKPHIHKISMKTALKIAFCVHLFALLVLFNVAVYQHALEQHLVIYKGIQLNLYCHFVVRMKTQN